MSNVSVQSDGAVVVATSGTTAPSLAPAPTSADPNFSHVARPAGFGETSSGASSSQAGAAGQASSANPSSAVPDIAAQQTTAPSNPAPDAPAAPSSTSTPVNAQTQEESSTSVAPAPSEAATTAPTAPPAASDPPPAPSNAVDPASQTVIDVFSQTGDSSVNPTAVEGSGQGTTSGANLNIFAPGVDDEQAGGTQSSVDPAYTVQQTTASPSASTTQPVATGSTQQTTSAQSQKVSSSSTSVQSTSARPTNASTTAASSTEANETAETTAASDYADDYNAFGNTSQATEVTTASASASDSSGADAASTAESSSQIDTTFVSGSTTLTGTAALAAASAAESDGQHKQKGKDGLSSFAIIGIVGGVLVFCIICYIVWFQWRKRRARKDMDRLEDIDDYSPRSTTYDPFGLAHEKHSGLDFFDEPLSSRRSQKSRVKSNVPSVMPHNPFADTAIIANPDPSPRSVEEQADYQRRLETQYTESLYTDPGDAGLGTAKSQGWFAEDDDRRPSYIDGPQSIYHETNDPDNPNAHPWTEVPLSARTPQSAKEAAPPVPPLPAAYQKRATRPETDFSYGNFYEGYDDPESRPVTQHTPATTMLLPWLNKETDAPPPIPVSGPVDPRALPAQPKRKDTGFGSPPAMPLRAPPAAAIAGKPQTPNKGWLGAIPSFR